MHDDKTLLVTGGSGHLSRRVLEVLLETTGRRLVTTTRDPAALAGLAERGVEVRQADYDDADGLVDAYRGANRVLVISSDAIGRRASQVQNAVGSATAAGVSRLLYTTTLAARPDASDYVTDDHSWSEQAVIGSGLEWTVRRHAMYTRHLFLFLFLPTAIGEGRLVTAMGDGGRPCVTREDSARMAAALASDVLPPRAILDVTGPEVIGHARLAQIVTELTGTELTLVAQSDDDSRAFLIAGGLDPDFAKGVLAFDRLGRDGYHAMVSLVVEQLTGRAPETVRQYLTRNRGELRANGGVMDVHMART